MCFISRSTAEKEEEKKESESIKLEKRKDFLQKCSYLKFVEEVESYSFFILDESKEQDLIQKYNSASLS